MDRLSWLLAALCLAQLAALAWALSRLYGRPQGSPAAPGKLDRFNELLGILLGLQEKGVSHSGAVSREDFGKAVLESACRLMRCDRGTLMLCDENAGVLKIVAAYGPVPESEPFISLPLLVKSKPIGVLNLHASGAPEPVDDTHARFLNLLAGEAAVMMHNLDLFERLETFYLEMVKTLARAVDSKDAYTHEHSDRASHKARTLAREIGLTEAMTRYVEYAALLHDIGKIGIDEAILLKPGKLTAEEYEVMKKHPIIGHQILAPVKFLGPVAQMVLYHQEWYDGRGYPEGLKGEAIPLGARIVAVIDAWDAMTSDRPYRKALSREVAIGELRRGAGTQFDPGIVEAFLKLEGREW